MSLFPPVCNELGRCSVCSVLLNGFTQGLCDNCADAYINHDGVLHTLDEDLANALLPLLGEDR